MRVFPCGRCGLLQEFESQSCVRCGSAQGFDWPLRTLVPDPPARCANATIADCNWIPQAGTLCFSCARTRTRPTLCAMPSLTLLNGEAEPTDPSRGQYSDRHPQERPVLLAVD